MVASIQLSRGKSKSARLNVTQALLFVTIVALIPSALMMAFPAETARMLGSSEHLLPMVTDYLLWFVPSWVFQIWITVPLFVIRLDGAPKLAMLCSLITAVINVVLDWLFIFPLAGESWEQHLPLPSASWPADWWRWSIYCLCSAFAFTTTQMECQEPAAFRAEYWLPVPYRSFCLIGRGNACCSYVRREPGIYVLSGGRWCRGIRYSVLYSFVFMVGNAIAQSAQPIISYNFGLGYKERVMAAERIALLTAVVCGVVATVAFTVYPYLLVGLSSVLTVKRRR